MDAVVDQARREAEVIERVVRTAAPASEIHVQPIVAISRGGRVRVRTPSRAAVRSSPNRPPPETANSGRAPLVLTG